MVPAVAGVVPGVVPSPAGASMVIPGCVEKATKEATPNWHHLSAEGQVSCMARVSISMPWNCTVVLATLLLYLI